MWLWYCCWLLLLLLVVVFQKLSRGVELCCVAAAVAIAIATTVAGRTVAGGIRYLVSGNLCQLWFYGQFIGYNRIIFSIFFAIAATTAHCSNTWNEMCKMIVVVIVVVAVGVDIIVNTTYNFFSCYLLFLLLFLNVFLSPCCLLSRERGK